MYFTKYTFLPFFTSIICLMLGIFVYSKNKTAPINQRFLIWCLFAFVGFFSYSMCYSTNHYAIAFFFAKIASVSCIGFSIVVYHLFVTFLELKTEKKLLLFGYAIYCLYALLSLSTNYFTAGLYKYFYGFYVKPGPLYPLAMLYFSFYMLRSWYQLINAKKKGWLADEKSNQFNYLVLGFSIAYLSMVDFIPKFNIEIYPFGSAFILIWAIIMAYAIVKHNLLDIRIVIKRGLVYSSLVSCLTILYFIVVILLERIFQIVIGYNSLSASLIFALIIVSLSIPLRNKIQTFIDQIFFKGTQIKLAEENEYLRKEVADKEKFRIAANLSSGLAHEIKNPLTSIKTFAQYLPEKVDDPEFIQNFSQIVNHEVERINDLVHQLLDFAKPAPPQFQSVDIEKLLQDILQFLNNDLLKHQITLKFDFTLGANRFIHADPNQMRQALLNIILNAIEAMPNGGVLSISSSLTTYHLALITIEDTGPGIDPKDLPKIFEPFYSKKDKGTGLGLAITKNIIEQHGGKIGVTSGVGAGTEFHITMSLYS